MKIKPHVLLFSLLLAGLVFRAGPAFSAGDYKVVEVKNGGALSGKTLFKGKAPEPTRIQIDKDVEICGQGDREIQEVRLSGDHLSNTVVYLDNIPSGKAFPETKEGNHLDQEKCAFVPHLQVMKNKDQISIMSKDPLSHTIHTYEVDGATRTTIFNVAVPNQFFKFSQKVRLRKGKVVKVECDTHKFMHAWMLVLDHPYFSVVDPEGSYSIENIPPGTYQLVAWNPVLGEQRKEVKVDPNGTLAVDFDFQWDGSAIDQR